MRNDYEEILKQLFCKRLFDVRTMAWNITQEEMAQKLSMAPRSYADLEHGINGCSAVTLTLFLVFVCPDPQEFLEELRDAFDPLGYNSIVEYT